MTYVRWSFVIVLSSVLSLLAVSLRAASGPPPGELAEGALSLLVSKRCEKSSRDTQSIEWPALVYARAKPPSWGRKPAGVCRGLDTWVLSEAVAAGTYWGQNDHAAIEASPNDSLFEPTKTDAAFKKMFGWELPERGDDTPAGNVFLRFNAKKLTAVFDRFYVKPTDKIGVATGQEVYDVLMKDFVTRFAREVALVQASLPKAKLAKLVKDYQAAAKEAGTRFKGPQYLKEVAATTLPQDNPESARAGRTLGVVLRRTADGTWPTVSRLLKKVVADYDPTLSKELGKNL
jgi:hypothetical protein